MLWEGWGQQRYAAQARWHSGGGGAGCSIRGCTRRAPSASDTEEHRARDNGDRRAFDRRPTAVLATTVLATAVLATAVLATAVLPPPRSRRVRKHSTPAPRTAVPWGVVSCH